MADAQPVAAPVPTVPADSLFAEFWDEAKCELILQGAASDLKFSWRNHKVPREAQARLAAFGFAEMATFTNLDVDKAAVQAFLVKELVFKENVGPQGKPTISRLMAAWNSASTRTTERADLAHWRLTSLIASTRPPGDPEGIQCCSSHFGREGRAVRSLRGRASFLRSRTPSWWPKDSTKWLAKTKAQYKKTACPSGNRMARCVQSNTCPRIMKHFAT